MDLENSSSFSDDHGFSDNRAFMKSGFDLAGHDFVSDQDRGLPPPEIVKAVDGSLPKIGLPAPRPEMLGRGNLYDCLCSRRSRRQYTAGPMALEELSFLLWATQGVQKIIPAYKNTGHITLRPVPSAGGRHCCETYLAVNNVAGLERGVYLYLPAGHQMAFHHPVEDLPGKLVYVYGGEQYREEAEWIGRAPVVFLWSCIPRRGEWRYHSQAHRLMLLDAGHICQNLYLACESIGCGACAIGAYAQSAADELLRIDGENEFVVYIAAAGKVKQLR